MPQPKKLTSSQLVDKLKRREVKSNKELRAHLKRAQKTVAKKIETLSERREAATSKKERDELFRSIDRIYNNAAAGVDNLMLTQVEKTAVEWHGQAKSDIAKKLGTTGGVVAFDRRVVQRYWELVHGRNQRYLAGVFTQRMASSDLRHLRRSLLDTFRQQSINGWTAVETHKNLQAKWDKLAKNLRGDRFVDATGRRWENADYLSMLTRTTFQRVTNESYVDSIVSEGYDLARIKDDGEPCIFCRAWSGLIVDVGGKQKSHFPSLSQAYDSGWGHPRCGCRIEAMIPEIDGDEIRRQRSEKAVKWKDPDAVQAYNDRIQLQGKRDAGMSNTEAVRSLKRDKLKRNASQGLFSNRLDGSIDALPNSVIDQMDTTKVPSFQPMKKKDPFASSRNSSRGGVIHMHRSDSNPEGGSDIFTAQFMDLQAKRGSSVPFRPEKPKVSVLPPKKKQPVKKAAKPKTPPPDKSFKQAVQLKREQDAKRAADAKKSAADAAVKAEVKKKKAVAKKAEADKALSVDISEDIHKGIDEVTMQGAKNEKFVCILPGGKTYRHTSGRSGGSLPRRMFEKDATFIHQHPYGFKHINNPIRSYGTSFSTADVTTSSYIGFKEMMAVTPRRTYRLKPGKGGWPTEGSIRQAYGRARKKTEALLTKNIKSKRLTVEHASVLHQHLINKSVAKELGMHYSWDKVNI